MYLLDILLTGGNLVLIGFGLLFVIVFVVTTFQVLREQRTKFRIKSIEQENKLNELGLMVQRDDAQIELAANEKSALLFDSWKQKELIEQIRIITQQATDRAQVELAVWKLTEIKAARDDSRKRSVRSVLGKIAEFLIPFSSYLDKYNPKDMRFIGSPIDFIIFDGIEEEREDVKIVFVEVKTGTSALTKRQKAIRKAITERNIDWIPISLKDIKDQLQADEEDGEGESQKPAL